MSNGVVTGFTEMIGGPGPVPTAWTVSGGSISYNGSILVPSNVINGSMGPGSINASALYVKGDPVLSSSNFGSMASQNNSAVSITGGAITGTAINNSVIGNSAPAAGTFTTCTATTGTFANHGTVVAYNVGTSGANVPLMNTVNSWGARQIFAPASIGVVTSTANFNIAPGPSPTSYSDGDMWTTISGLFVRINGSTVGPLGSGGTGTGGSFHLIGDAIADGNADGSNTSITVTKTSGVAFGTAATRNIGTSGATIPLLNSGNTWSAPQTFGSGNLTLAGSLSGTSVLNAPSTGGGVLTLPPGADTVVGLAATQTLTNKTLTSPTINSPVIVGGTINGASVGATTPGTGNFSSLNAGATTVGNLSATAINNTPIGNTTPYSGAFTTLSASGAASFTGGLTVNSVTVSGTLTASGAVNMSPTTGPLITINPATQGTIDNMAIGNTTAASGKFTSVTCTNLTASTASFTAINNTPVGNITPSTGSFTTLAGQTTNAGALSATTATLSGTLTGVNANFSGTVTAVTFSGGLNVTGAVSLSPANANVIISPTGTGKVTINPATAGNIDNEVIGNTTPLAGTFTSLTATGTFNGNGAVNLSPASFNVTLSPTGTGKVIINPATIGSIDRMAIGNTVPSTINATSGVFQISSTGNVLLANQLNTGTSGNSAIYGLLGSTYGLIGFNNSGVPYSFYGNGAFFCTGNPAIFNSGLQINGTLSINSPPNFAICTAGGYNLDTPSTASLLLKFSGVAYYNISYNQFFPQNDAATYLGNGTNRWYALYASVGTIQTSDENEKQDIRPFEEAEFAVAKRLKKLLIMYRWKDQVAKDKNARLYAGIIAQRVVEAFTEEGLDPNNYALWQKDELGEWVAEKIEDGKIVEPMHFVPNGQYRYSVDYSQVLAFIIAAL